MKTARQVNHKKEHNLPVNAIENFQYKIFDKIDYNLINELDLSDENDEVNENILN
jgi:hypothetical protein